MNKKVRWYFELAADIFNAYSKDIEYSTVHFIHALDFEKIAIVGSGKAEKFMQSMMRPFTQATIVHFDLAKKDEGMKWIVA